MKIKNIIVTFWFNQIGNFKELTEEFNNNLNTYFPVWNFINLPANFEPIAPRINAQSGSGHSIFTMSRINAQISTNYDQNFNEDVNKCMLYIEERAKKIYENISNQGIDILYSAIFVNLEKDEEHPIEKIEKNLLKAEIKGNINELGIRTAVVKDNKYYRIITLNNAKDYTMQKQIKPEENNIIIPLISLKDATMTKQYISMSYELNDKYSFDNVDAYNNNINTINDMFENVKEDLKNNIELLIDTGKI